MTPDTLIAVATVVIAIATGFAAAAAWWAARATRRTTEASLFSQLMTEYASPAMSAALKQLAANLRGWSEDPQHRSFDELVDRWARITAQRGGAENVLNDARRTVSHFYRKATRMIEEGLLTGGLCTELADLSGRDLMHDMVIPMERALAKHLGDGCQDDPGYIGRFQRVFPRRTALIPVGDSPPSPTRRSSKRT